MKVLNIDETYILIDGGTGQRWGIPIIIYCRKNSPEFGKAVAKWSITMTMIADCRKCQQERQFLLPSNSWPQHKPKKHCNCKQTLNTWFHISEDFTKNYAMYWKSYRMSLQIGFDICIVWLWGLQHYICHGVGLWELGFLWTWIFPKQQLLGHHCVKCILDKIGAKLVTLWRFYSCEYMDIVNKKFST